MPNNYLFLDGDASLLSARSSLVSGTTVHEPYVTIDSVLLSLPVTFANSPSISGAVTIVGNSSVSGTVGASIIGQLPAGTAMIGSITTLQGTNPWRTLGSVSGTVDIGTIPGSILAYQAGGWNASITSSNPSSVLVGASIFGQLPAGTAVLGSVAVLQGTSPWNIAGSVATTLQGSANVIGSVATLQGTNPWITTFSNSSIFATQQGTHIVSIVGSNPSSTLVGIYGHRNDAVASYLGGDLSWRQIATDSAGRITTKPFAAEESRIEGYVTLTSTSLTTLVAAAGAGLRNYVTDLWFANTGATTTLVTLSDSAGSILGYTIAPTASGSNLPGLLTPIRTGANASFNIQAGSATSTLYATVKGFKAP